MDIPYIPQTIITNGISKEFVSAYLRTSMKDVELEFAEVKGVYESFFLSAPCFKVVKVKIRITC